MNPFVTHNGVAINFAAVSFIDFRKEGQATVHSLGQSFVFDGDDATALRDRVEPTPAQAGAPVAE